MSLVSLARYDDAEDVIRDEDHNLVTIPPKPLLPMETNVTVSPPILKPSPPVLDSGGKPKSLVSYEGDLTDDDTSSGNDDYEDDTPSSKTSVVNLRLFDANSVLSSIEVEPSHLNDSFDDSPKDDHVRLPPEPQGRCSKSLQEKIAKMIDKKKNGQMNVNDYVQQKKAFRNPSIYEKLVNFIGIDEYGTNYPRRLYDPTIWGPESYFDALAKAQKEYHKEKEKEKIKRTQVEFVVGTKKPATSQAPAIVTVIEKKSKWDQKVAPPPKVVVPKVPATVQAAIKSNTKI